MEQVKRLDDIQLKNTIREYVCGELIQDTAYPLGDDDPLVSGGLVDSFGVVQIHIFIEKTFGVYIPDDQLKVENLDSLNKIVTCIRTLAAEAGGS